jgi:hypothetical protein
VKHHSALILIGFLALGAACGCGSPDGAYPEPGGDEGAEGTAKESGRTENIGPDPRSYRRRTSRGTRAYLPGNATDHSYTGVLDSSCNCPDDREAYRTVFVSPTGADDAPGTADAPVLSLDRAIRLAAERGYSVYVCP